MKKINCVACLILRFSVYQLYFALLSTKVLTSLANTYLVQRFCLYCLNALECVMYIKILSVLIEGF